MNRERVRQKGDYYDNPDRYAKLATRRVEQAERRFHQIMALGDDTRPDFLCVGGSGSLVFQTPSIFREIAPPAVKRVTELAAEAGMPTHVHSCGPEAEPVKIMAAETALTVIDPLEISPMGDCDLAELKRLYGDRIALKGNLHTTETMLLGSTDDVRAAAIAAMRDAGDGGRFILSTGDQCGRAALAENLHTLVATARTLRVYNPATGELPNLPTTS